MKSSLGKLLRGACTAGVLMCAALGTPSVIAAPDTDSGLAALIKKAPADVTTALSSLSKAQVVDAADDGLPTFLRGELGRTESLAGADTATADTLIRSKLGPALAAFRLTPSDLKLRKINVDANGNRHARYDQTFRGLDVIGGDLVAHVDSSGVIYGLNGTARGLSSALGLRAIGEQSALANASARPEYTGINGTVDRMVYFVSPEGESFKAYELTFSGKRGRDPVLDKVYVDADSGKVVGVHPKVYFAESRKVYTANNGTTLPGTLKRSEGQAATSDTDINAAYDGTGATYEAYKTFWNRDSYNNAGATLISSVHYDKNYCNAYWDSTQMVYGDGDSSQGCAPLARAQDVTAHELTHAVTENESNLTYSGESGGLNEALSDIFGAFVEAWVDGGKSGTTLKVSSDTWLIGEDILPPALRYMNDPAKDGASLDYYSSTAGNKDVHYSSGIANLAFYLLSQGGTHPRSKSTITVPALGMEKAIRIFYEAQINVLTSSSKFLAAGNATVTAAKNLGYSVADQSAVAKAWQAVGVNATDPAGGGSTGETVLTSGTAVTVSGASGSQTFFKITVPSGRTTLTISTSGGSGDVDLYTRKGSRPTTSTYDCRPYKSGNAETCTVSNPAAATYYILLNGYSSYSGVSLKATY